MNIEARAGSVAASHGVRALQAVNEFTVVSADQRHVARLRPRSRHRRRAARGVGSLVIGVSNDWPVLGASAGTQLVRGAALRGVYTTLLHGVHCAVAAGARASPLRRRAHLYVS